MKNTITNSNFFNIHTILVLLVLFAINPKLHASAKRHKIQYKVEQCDCLGYKEDMLLFLSDITETQIFNIVGEGSSRKAAERQAQNMCLELYRRFENSVDSSSVSHSGCHVYKRNTRGNWDVI